MISHSQSNTPFRLYRILALFLVGVSLCQAAYVMQVAAHSEECFVIPASGKGGTLFGNYEILENSAKPMSIVAVDARNGRLLYKSRKKASNGSIKVTMQEKQDVEVCIHNGILNDRQKKLDSDKKYKPHPDNLPRKVGVSFTYQPYREEVQLHSINAKAIASAHSLKSRIAQLVDHMGFIRVREGNHREVVEGTFTKLMTWTFFQAVGVVVVAGAQIMYLQRSVERKRYI